MYSTKKIEIMTEYPEHDPLDDTYVEDDIEIDFEDKYKNQIRTTLYHIGNLKKLAEIEESRRTFGFLTLNEKITQEEILNQYIL